VVVFVTVVLDVVFCVPEELWLAKVAFWAELWLPTVPLAELCDSGAVALESELLAETDALVLFAMEETKELLEFSCTVELSGELNITM
jgi:hypothetical protein